MIQSWALCLSLTAAAQAPGAAGRPAPGGPGAGLSEPDEKRALLLIDLLIEEGRLEEAAAFLCENRPRAADGAPWDLRAARVAAARGEHLEAAAIYRRLLSARADDAGLLVSLGEHSYAGGDLEGAREAFERALKLSDDPLIPYYLSELHQARGREGESRRWGQAALESLERPRNAREERLRLRLAARLNWRDSLDDAFGRLHDRQPGETEVLASWASALLARDLPRAAAEPIALLRERAPRSPASWRKLELSRLRALGDRSALGRHVEETRRELPDDPEIAYSLAEIRYRERDWDCAEELAAQAGRWAPLRRASEEFLLDVRQEGHHRAGPAWRWRESDSTRSTEWSAAYSGYPARGLRLEGEAGSGGYRRKATGSGAVQSGGRLAASLERRAWRAGLDADVRTGNGPALASPGLFADWTPDPRWSVEAAASFGRAWRDSTESVIAGARMDLASTRASWQAASRLRLSLEAAGRRLSARQGGFARQGELAPQASWTLLQRPLYLAAAWRFVSYDVSGDDDFFRSLPLLRRARTHYGILSAGKRWLDGRLRLDAYVFNGHDSGRSRRFGTDELVGFGAGLEGFAGSLDWRVAYETSQDAAQGVSGLSRSIRASARWRWAPGRRCAGPDGREPRAP